MSQGQDWNTPDATPTYQPPPTGQGYQQQPPPPWQGGYQQPQGPYGYGPAPYQQPYPQGYPPQAVPKNPGIALLISFFVPGIGSVYAGKTNTGIIILIGYIISWVLTIIFIGFLGIIGFWIWGMIDAYQAAQAWNRARGLES